MGGMIDHGTPNTGDEWGLTLAKFQEGLTRALNRHGVPAMPSWDAAIDWLAEHGSARARQGKDHELVRVDRLMVERLIDDDSEPVVVIRLMRLDDGTCVMVLKTPQGEDHEAGIEAAARELGRWRPVNDTVMVARAVVDAYLSRVSPSRDGG